MLVSMENLDDLKSQIIWLQLVPDILEWVSYKEDSTYVLKIDFQDCLTEAMLWSEQAGGGPQSETLPSNIQLVFGSLA